jgi:hypothetical protein
MKTKQNLFFGIAVLLVAAMFIVAGCGIGGGGENTGWPSNAVLAEYGISGMTVPAGATNITYSIATVGGNSLTIYFTVSSANDSAINTSFTSNGWTEDGIYSGSESSVTYMYSKAGFIQASYSRSGTACQIQVAKE